MTQFDPSIRVQDDLFRHVNGPWLRTAEIKPDRATAGSFVTLVDEAEAKVREIIETASKAPQDDEQRKIGDLYASFMMSCQPRAISTTLWRPLVNHDGRTRWAL